MQFYEWLTVYQRAKKEMKRVGKRIDSDIPRWYDTTSRIWLDGGKSDFPLLDYDPRPGNSVAGLYAEKTWWCTNQPYYKVFPLMANMMAEVSIEIPVSELRLPYPAFTILLPNSDENDFVGEDGQRLKAVFVSEIHVENKPDNRFKIMTEAEARLSSGATRALRIGYQFDGEDASGDLDFDYTMSLHAESNTLEEEFQTSWGASWKEARRAAAKDWWLPGKQLVSRIMRLAVATCFFGIDCHEVVMPDLQRKVVEQHQWRTKRTYNDAFVDLAKQKRKDAKHWTIGNEIVLPRPVAAEPSDDGGGQPREVKNAYMRRGHMRWQPVGPGRKGRELIFIHPHLCRADLKFGNAAGYRIPDEQ